VRADLGGGIRGVELKPGDPLCQEWVAVTLGADTCRALVARELAGQGGTTATDDSSSSSPVIAHWSPVPRAAC
jgi:hypothetical protein